MDYSSTSTDQGTAVVDTGMIQVIMIPVCIDMTPEPLEPRYWRPHEIADPKVEHRIFWRTPRRESDRRMGDKKFYTLGGRYRPAIW